MKITLDSDNSECTVLVGSKIERYPLYSDDALRTIAQWYLKIGWNQKYTYTFSWLGRPLIQLPEDMFRLQEVIFRVKPDVIVETGVAHGGSLVFYASLCELLGMGRVIGVDIQFKSENRAAIEHHSLSHRIELLEGSSTSLEVLDSVREKIKSTDKTLIILDSNHSYDHVLNELSLYSPFVSKGSYIIATDGIMEDLSDVPNGTSSWITDNPARAARDFADQHRDFILEEPAWSFNESTLDKSLVTYWPSAYLRRV